MLITKPFIEQDLNAVNTLRWMWNKSSVLYSELPKIGYIAYDEFNEPLGTAFLRSCEGNIGIIDSLIVNPTIENRSQVIDSLVIKVIKAAKELEFTHLLAITDNLKVIQRAKNFNFNTTEFVVLTNELTHMKE